MPNAPFTLDKKPLVGKVKIDSFIHSFPGQIMENMTPG